MRIFSGKLSGMAKAKRRREQFNLRLPPDVRDHLEDRYRQTGVEKQLQALAGLVAFECCSDVLRQRMIQWATRIARGEVAWEDLLAAVGDRKAEVLDQKKLLKMLEATGAA